ncbi:MAG: M20/M25/M40 family metallo-hydrolase [Gammaproteobacteria bacterium]|nr:M20/M25/M40 family metallo-hydrolase [Gammaproteobacteria bacterium]
MTYEKLRAAVDQQFDTIRQGLEDLTAVPSVSAPGFDPDNVRASAEVVAGLLRDAGFPEVRLLESEGAHPAVFAHYPAPAGAPTVLLYAHHDVQPPGDEREWTSPPFEPAERDGRIYGRGIADDKSGVLMHVGAMLAHEGKPPVGVKVIIEGEEEIGSLHLEDFLHEHQQLFSADVIVIGDSGNWKVGVPALTTSLRGLVDCVIEIRTADHALHSGEFGGPVPDALTILARTLATLHDEQGNVAIPDLVSSDTADPLDLTEAEFRAQAGVVDGLELIGEGSITSRLWTMPSISILAIDAPPVAEAINALVPVARAKVSMRLAPGQNPPYAMKTLVNHLESHVPWGAQVTVTPGASGEAFALATEGPRFEIFRAAMREAWGTEPVNMGVGGSIPFVAAFSETYPGATIVLTGAQEPESRIHAPDESLDLEELRRSVLAEAIVLELLAKQ